MRIYDIALMLALFGAVTGILDGSGWFIGGEIPVEASGLTEDELNRMKPVAGASLDDPGGLIGAAWAGWNVLLIMIEALYRVFWIWDLIVGVFGVGSAGVAGIIQIGIWMTYGIGLLQLIRKTPITYMQ